MHDMTWVSHAGRVWELTSSGFTAGLMAGGITGLVGSVEDETSQLVGVPGQVLLRQKVRPLEGTLKVLLRDDKEMERTYAEFRQSFHHLHEGTLRLGASHAGSFSTRLRLGGPIGEPEVKPGAQGHHVVEVPLICDSGLWWGYPQEGSGSSIKVTNFGDVDIWPELVWVGSATVTMPSGLRVEAPFVSRECRMMLNSRDAFEIRAVDDGELMTTQIRSVRRQGVWPECVPPGREAIFKTSSSRARLVWRRGVLDPWA